LTLPDKLQVLTVILVSTQDLWDVKPCLLLNSYLHSKGALCFHNKGQAVFLDCVTEALRFFSVLVAICQWTLYNVSEYESTMFFSKHSLFPFKYLS